MLLTKLKFSLSNRELIHSAQAVFPRMVSGYVKESTHSRKRHTEMSGSKGSMSATNSRIVQEKEMRQNVNNLGEKLFILWEFLYYSCIFSVDL